MKTQNLSFSNIAQIFLIALMPITVQSAPTDPPVSCNGVPGDCPGYCQVNIVWESKKEQAGDSYKVFSFIRDYIKADLWDEAGVQRIWTGWVNDCSKGGLCVWDGPLEKSLTMRPVFKGHNGVDRYIHLAYGDIDFHNADDGPKENDGKAWCDGANRTGELQLPGAKNPEERGAAVHWEWSSTVSYTF